MTSASHTTTQPLLGTRRDLWASLIVGLLCMVVYNVNGRAISAGDAFPARYQPFAIWGHRTVLLDPIAKLTSQGRKRPTIRQTSSKGVAFWMVQTHSGHLVSLYSVVLPVLISPLYLPAVAYVYERGWTDERIDGIARIMEKLTASFVAALSASLLYLVLRRRAQASIATLLTIAYAFGTTTWVISSQALWQHGMAQLLVVGLILLLTAPCTVPRALAAGLLCGLIAGNRPADVVLAAALGAYGLFWAGRRAALVVAAALVPAVAVLFYNLTVVGALTGAYQLVGHAEHFFGYDMSAGLAGLLFSPTRGLFVFSPFLLFLVFAWRHPPRDRAERGLTLAMIAGVVAQVLLYSKTDWRAGISWGPRFLTDLLPLLIWLLVPVVAALRRPGRACFVAAVVIAIAIESVGAFAYTGVTDLPIFAIASGPHEMRAAWNWRNAPFVACLSRGTVDTLDTSFRTAAARIQDHQRQPGYWLTDFTSAARFEQPHKEMNTYVTSLLVDLLDPVASAAGLGDSVQRARRHLTAQIEAGGLVRYHGLPDAPGIGTLGCVITPDSDNTALVWRIAPAQDRQRLSAALATIDGYRTPDGLYRTWLAPRAAYQCLDPGSDPNPADVAIQIHLLQLLLHEKPLAGRALCDALRKHIDDDRIWVYYRLAPLVPILRTRDLERAGCPLELPASRIRTTVAGQQIWISLAQLLSRGSRPGVPRPDDAEITTVLRQLADQDFALVRQSPPLLYHNDLTATVPRFYWSEDVGYALWLRLAQEAAHR